jgi:hypothetical protein
LTGKVNEAAPVDFFPVLCPFLDMLLMKHRLSSISSEKALCHAPGKSSRALKKTLLVRTYLSRYWFMKSL